MKPPVFPKELIKADLRQSDFEAYDEYNCIRTEGGQSVGKQPEHLVLNQVQFQVVSMNDSH